MIRALIPKGHFSILAWGFQDQSVRSSLKVTKVDWALAVQLEAEYVPP